MPNFAQPPVAPVFSTTATDRPFSAAFTAAHRPAGPAPTITKSTVFSVIASADSAVYGASNAAAMVSPVTSGDGVDVVFSLVLQAPSNPSAPMPAAAARELFRNSLRDKFISDSLLTFLEPL